jgi:hypothetical protein
MVSVISSLSLSEGGVVGSILGFFEVPEAVSSLSLSEKGVDSTLGLFEEVAEAEGRYEVEAIGELRCTTMDVWNMLSG